MKPLVLASLFAIVYSSVNAAYAQRGGGGCAAGGQGMSTATTSGITPLATAGSAASSLYWQQMQLTYQRQQLQQAYLQQQYWQQQMYLQQQNAQAQPSARERKIAERRARIMAQKERLADAKASKAARQSSTASQTAEN